MDRKRKTQINKCNISKCCKQNRTEECNSALSGVTHHNGYKGKICDIWHRKGDENLFSDWLTEIKRSRSLIKGREKNLKITSPYVVTHTCVVELIFKVCKELEQPADTRYRTVELFDRFIASQFMDIVKTVKQKQNQLTEWSNVIPRVSNQALLRVMSCIQLASKYCAHSSIVPPKTAHSYLTKRGQIYTMQSVLLSERRVFKSLNYDIGVPTILVFVDVLLPLLREIIEDKIYTVCINIVDIIYLQRHEIFKKLNDRILTNCNNCERSYPAKSLSRSYEFDGLYCGASCIMAAAKIYYPSDDNLINSVNVRLANFIERPRNDIITLSTIILQTIGM